jgi:hypothetical protein
MLFQTKESRPRHGNPGASAGAFWPATRVDLFVRALEAVLSPPFRVPRDFGFIDHVQFFLLELTNGHDVHNQVTDVVL